MADFTEYMTNDSMWRISVFEVAIKHLMSAASLKDDLFAARFLQEIAGLAAEFEAAGEGDGAALMRDLAKQLVPDQTASRPT